jgi:hypothetical protein
MKLASVIVFVVVAGVAVAQSSAGTEQPYISFSVANSPVEPSQYSLRIGEDGAGIYKATYTASGGDSAALPVDRPIKVHNPVLKGIFSTAHKYRFFATPCQAPHGHVAFTGQKTLAYMGADGKGSCTFNYSQDEAINNAAVNLTSVAYTLEIGERLAKEHRYDRLSLDGELAALQTAVTDRRALELENIAPELQSIADDDAVMNRARQRARALLAESIQSR